MRNQFRIGSKVQTVDYPFTPGVVVDLEHPQRARLEETDRLYTYTTYSVLLEGDTEPGRYNHQGIEDARPDPAKAVPNFQGYTNEGAPAYTPAWIG